MTDAGVGRTYWNMLLARSREERLKIACSMHATAQALVRASVLARNPAASPADMRQALFQRFYGHEFDGAARERIAEWLGQVEVPSPGALRLGVSAEPPVPGAG